ncbi:MAG: acylglycerol kinase family protein [Acetobacter orientalis]|uniref:diacylglycerol/lipid kinase family protein n=1 Tax=Acetobacter orientalis TaxID=146474 RepID=UPI0039E9DB44
MPERFALIHNPRSRRNLKADRQYLETARTMLGPLFHAPETAVALRATIEELARQNVECLVVDGGDGTVGKVLSVLYASSYPNHKLPMIALLPSGNTNLIAADVGFGKRGGEALEHLQSLARAHRLGENIKQRQPLVVSWPGQKRAPELGFFGGAGAFTKGIEIAHRPDILNTYAHDAAVLATLMVTARQLFSPKLRQQWLNGTPAGLGLDGQPADVRNRFLFLCTGLHKLSHKIWPFWRPSWEVDKGISYLDIDAHPERLLRAVWNLMRGKAPSWIQQSASYRSGTAARIRLRSEQSFVLDGEVLETGPEQCLDITAGPVVSFLQA